MVMMVMRMLMGLLMVEDVVVVVVKLLVWPKFIKGVSAENLIRACVIVQRRQ